MSKQVPRYSTAEEVAHSVTHGIGVALAIAAVSILVVLGALRGNAWHVVSFSVYGATLIALYLASTLYHAVPRARLKRRLRVLDHASIYLLIAGTYTPFTLVTLRGPWGWSIFGIIWGLAGLGVVLKLRYTGRAAILSCVVYAGMGWLVAIAFKPLLHSLPTGGIAWLLAGGLAYTGGIAFYAWKRLPGQHAIWHLFVLAGSGCHFIAMLLYVLPRK